MELSKYNKFWMALTMPLGTLLFVMAPVDGQAVFQVTAAEWYLVLLSAAAAVGVRQIPNNK